MKLHEYYGYLYYRLYKFFSTGVVWMTEWKASLAMDALEIWLLASIGNYYQVITKNTTSLSIKMPIVWIPFSVIILINFFSFHSKDQWKGLVKHFDQLDKKRNKIGGWVVFCFILAVIANLIFSFYLMSKVDWGRYR